MKKRLNKKTLFSLFSFPLIALPIGLATLNNLNNSVHLISKSLNVNETITDESINPDDTLPVFDSSITSFGDYIVSYEDNNISPVNVTIPQLAESTDQNGPKAGGATVGMTANKQTITVTTYAGLLLWSHKLTENPLLKNYYKTTLSVDEINTYKVVNFAYLESKNILFVLFGNESTTDGTTTLNNLVVFGLDINSGAIVVPTNAKLVENQVIAKARDNSEFIFFNSSDQLIVTSGKTVNDINSSTKIMSFDDNSGFANVENKGNDEESNNFNYSSVNGVDANSYLLGIIPSNVKGVNYSIWLNGKPSKDTNAAIRLSYSTGTTKSGTPEKSINNGSNATESFNYYVVAIKDDFTNLFSSPRVVNIDDDSKETRGFLTLDTNLPDFNSIYKRFFLVASTTNNTITNEKVGILIDSYDDMFASFVVSFFSIVHSGKEPSVGTQGDINSGLFMNYKNDITLGPKASDLDNSSGLEDNVLINNWEFNSVGYDKELKFVYFSLSGEEYDTDAASDMNGKYLTNTRYINLSEDSGNIILQDEAAKRKRVLSDSYVVDNPYTLSDVNSNTYTNKNNIYLTKQTINGDNGQWLSTTKTDLVNDSKNFEPTTDSKIDFYSLENLTKNIQNKSEVLNDVMPSKLDTKSFDDFLKNNNWSDFVKFNNVEGDDETGEISLQTEITYPNNFGDNTNAENNGSVSYNSYIKLVGITSKDFIWSFKETSDTAVEEFKKKYSAKKIVEGQNKGWAIENLLQSIEIKNKIITITENMVTLSNPSDDSLKIDIKIPIKTSATDTYGQLPFGFPEEKAVLTKTYSGFIGDEAPNFIPLPDIPIPDDSNNPGDSSNNNSKPEQGLSVWSIVGIVIGILAISAIIVIAVMLIRKKAKLKI
ncbi:MAG: hypothetical protein K2F52_00060 [Malacoplasma sp.]|nr:hypothetical protein [Malacoplasma sp.]